MTAGWGPRSYLKVQLRVPDSFPLEGVGGGGREESINDHPSLSQFGLVGAIIWQQRGQYTLAAQHDTGILQTSKQIVQSILP